MTIGIGTGLGLLGPLFMLLLWIGVITLGIWLARALFQGSGHSQSPPANHEQSAREILDLRYVRGEITREQYELMQSDLG